MSRATPNRDAEIVVRHHLKELDPLLDIQWMDAVGRYALTCRWPERDRRWELHRAGEIGAPEDILGWFTEGIQDANGLPLDPLDMLDRIIEWLGKMNNDRESWRERMRRSMERNRELQRKRKQQIVEDTMDVTKHYAKLHLGEGTVNLGDGTRESIHVPQEHARAGLAERKVYKI